MYVMLCILLETACNRVNEGEKYIVATLDDFIKKDRPFK